MSELASRIAFQASCLQHDLLLPTHAEPSRYHPACSVHEGWQVLALCPVRGLPLYSFFYMYVFIAGGHTHATVCMWRQRSPCEFCFLLPLWILRIKQRQKVLLPAEPSHQPYVDFFKNYVSVDSVLYRCHFVLGMRHYKYLPWRKLFWLDWKLRAPEWNLDGA